MSDGDSTPQSMSFDRVLEILNKGTVDTEYGMMRWSSNYTFMISVAHEGTNIRAVYKPQSGERPLWDFPDGTLCQRELAAFLTSQELGWQIVPPTALRKGPRGLGSMQFFIDHNPEHNYFSFEADMFPQLMRLVAFDVVVNNADRKGGHCLVDSQGRLWGIDHGITFHTQHKLRTVIWDFAGQPIPETDLSDLEMLCGKLDNANSAVRNALCSLLSDAEINACRGRIRRLLKSRKFPQPGPGPNYPWPPV